MIGIICFILMLVGFIILSKSKEQEQKSKENEIKHDCIFAVTCREAPRCLNERKESCFTERKY